MEVFNDTKPIRPLLIHSVYTTKQDSK